MLRRLSCLAVIAFNLFLLALLPASARLQTCTPPTFQGFPGGAVSIDLRFLANGNPAQQYLEIQRTNGALVGRVPVTFRNYTDVVGCSVTTNYDLTIVGALDGSRCLTRTGNCPPGQFCVPSTSPCNDSNPATLVLIGAKNAASYTQSIAPESLVAFFAAPEAPFANTDADATPGQPLPTTLAGVSITVGNVPAGLINVRRNQVNAYVPGSFPVGTVLGIRVERQQMGNPIESFIRTDQVNPGIFTANATGSGAPAAVTLENGVFYAVNGRTIPLSAAPTLVLFLTGVRQRSDLTNVKVFVAGQPLQPDYVGAQPQFLGLDQINVTLPSSLPRGTATLQVMADGWASNPVMIMLGN
jgi:uncharacterized protein (TIGR03437 family)